MKIALATDAWYPQVNGVVRTLARLGDELVALSHQTTPITPVSFLTVPCPTYPEIRLALRPGRRLARLLEAAAPEALHIATEGPLGMAARHWCLGRRRAFTTSFHTRFPEYVAARIGLPPGLGYAWLRRFHRPSAGVMVATERLRDELAGRGFTQLKLWCRGVDTELFRPRETSVVDLPGPSYLYVGRVAVEKNLKAFLDLDLADSKLVVGGGPQLESLRRRYPEVSFPGPKFGEELAAIYASCDVFVFPSLTDTFGLVMLEALASGLPVAAFPVPGPLDVIGDSGAGVLDHDLGLAARRALAIPRAHCRDHALRYSWRHTAERFLAYLAPWH
jgi:1,2-diacylglycerol 3-alpha-glucosyltransferase/glucuronosyltransferase